MISGGDSCSFLAPQADGCSAPRPCVDCLLFDVASEPAVSTPDCSLLADIVVGD